MLRVLLISSAITASAVHTPKLEDDDFMLTDSMEDGEKGAEEAEELEVAENQEELFQQDDAANSDDEEEVSEEDGGDVEKRYGRNSSKSNASLKSSHNATSKLSTSAIAGVLVKSGNLSELREIVSNVTKWSYSNHSGNRTNPVKKEYDHLQKVADARAEISKAAAALRSAIISVNKKASHVHGSRLSLLQSIGDEDESLADEDDEGEIEEEEEEVEEKVDEDAEETDGAEEHEDEEDQEDDTQHEGEASDDLDDDEEDRKEAAEDSEDEEVAESDDEQA